MASATILSHRGRQALAVSDRHFQTSASRLRLLT